MNWQPRSWTVPQVLLAGLTIALLVSVGIGLTTTGTAFGVYNPAWDGASDLTDVTSGPDTDSSVALNTSLYQRVDPTETVVIVLSPSESYTETELARIRSFVRRGGTIVVAEDFGPVGNQLLRGVGADTRFDGRLVRDERVYSSAPALPRATNVSPTMEAAGVSQLTLNYGTVLEPPASNDAVTLVRTSEFAYLDADRNGTLDDSESLARRPVVIRERLGNGTVYSVSDPSLFINAMLTEPDNRAFVTALAEPHSQVVLDYSGFQQHPPLSVALLRLRQSVLAQLVAMLLGLAAIGSVSRRATIRRRLPWPSRSDERRAEPTRLTDRESIRRAIHQRHPDWDEERLDRVITDVLARRDGDERDE